MKRIFLFFRIIVLFYSCNSNLQAQNIALGKRYTYSSSANYALTSPDTDQKLLTDGVYTKGQFWTSKTTVGWQYKKRINIEIDLDKISRIDKVAFNTVRGNAGVQFPSNIFVFTSPDKITYTYAGDAAAENDNIPGSYEVKKFTLTGVNKLARYVQFVIVPNGSYIFCDEIEVFASNDSKMNILKKQINISNVNSAVDSIQRRKSADKKMAFQVARIKSNVNNDNSVAGADVSVATTQEMNLAATLTSAKAERLRSLKLKYGREVIIDKVNPWEVLSSPFQPKGKTDRTFNIVTVINRVQYGAFVVTNLSAVDKLFDCHFDNGTTMSSNELFIVPFVTSGKEYREVADPLVEANKSAKLSPGESCVYLFKITGKKPGQIINNITVHSGDFTAKLSINVKVLNIGPFNRNYSLNANNWAYLTYPLISDRQDAAISDLLTHHINTIIVPPNKIPIVGNNDFSVFVSYASKLKAFHNIFLFMDVTSAAYKNSFKQDAFMSDNWKVKFNIWYNGIIQSAKSVDISPSQIFLYPYDEVQGENIQQYSNFLNWIKTDHPDIRTFSTLSTKPAIDALRPLLTISQVSNIGGLIQSVEASKYDNLWIYDTQPNAELLSPYSYYRLMAWKAFYYGYKGIGFWNYADYENGSTNKADIDNFDGVNATNYSVIYNASGKGLISSRRWEAFRLGMEDYELLKMYSAKNGLPSAKLLAGIVVNNTNDLDKADLIRNQLIQSLSK